MGTNFYFRTKVKSLAEQFEHYELCDEPDFHYDIHLAKTSCGWLPLFQSHKGIIYTVENIESVYKKNKNDITIIDEYDDEYTWDEFKKRVIEFNGGYDGAIPKTPVPKVSPGEFGYDPNMPDYVPVSHFDYKGFDYDTIYKDPEGYEFETVCFG